MAAVMDLTGAHHEAYNTEAARKETKTINDSLKAYFAGIKNYALLSIEDEKVLSQRISRGDKKARKRMIEANLRLVINMAKRYMTRGLPLADLIEEGNIGLIKSVEKFRANLGCRFSTYATYWIRQAIERAILNQSAVVRVPVHVANDISKMTRVSSELRRNLKREPTHSEVADKMGVRGRYVKKLTTVIRKTCSVDACLNEDSEETLLDRIEEQKLPSSVELMSMDERTAEVREWLQALTDSEKEIIRLRFGIDRDAETLEKIGRRFNVTRERIRQIEARALRKMREIGEQNHITSLDAI